MNDPRDHTLPTVSLCNLGCSKNQVDGEHILGFLHAAGFRITARDEDADCIIVNTCTFIQQATQETIDTILRYGVQKKDGRCSTLIVTGCFSQRFRDEARSALPEVDCWCSLDNWEAELAAFLHIQAPTVFSRQGSTPDQVHVQYLKIGDGCSHRCSFCIIPSLRGPFRSRPLPDIITEAQQLFHQGAREGILVAQDTSRYGRDRGLSLVRLLERLLHDTDFPWIRLMYLHPSMISDDLLRYMGAENRICSYIDVPLQHISDPILRSMRRTPLSAGIHRLLYRIRRFVPDAAIRTSFILGYPGEQEKHFKELLSFVEHWRFEKCGVFPYSPEYGTRAAGLRPRPRAETANRRCETLMSLQREISAEILAGHVGKIIPVHIDDCAINPQNTAVGRTQWDAPEIDGRVLLSGNPARWKPGMIVPVTITGSTDFDLTAVAYDRRGTREKSTKNLLAG